jgi:hypothetical protein
MGQIKHSLIKKGFPIRPNFILHRPCFSALRLSAEARNITELGQASFAEGVVVDLLLFRNSSAPKSEKNKV